MVVPLHVFSIIALDSNTAHRLHRSLFHELLPPPLPSLAQQGALILAMAHDSGLFRSLTRYEDYYLSGGDLFFLVRGRCLVLERLANKIFSCRSSTMSSGYIDTSSSAKALTSRASSRHLHLPVLNAKAPAKRMPLSSTTLKFMSLHGSFGYFTTRE